MLKTNGRINKFDNLKGFAIILIVLGHLPGLLSPAFDHRFIYIIHLPIFFFVAGYFSKIGPDEPIKSFKRLMIPFFLFSIIWKICLIIMAKDVNIILFFEPDCGLWFLVSLFTMKMLLPIIDRLRYPLFISLMGALLISALGIPGTILGITRTFIYLPIFIIGFYYNDYVAKLTEYNEKIVLFLNKTHNKYLILILIILSCIIAAYSIPAKVIFLQHPYGKHMLSEMILKLILIFLGISFALTLNGLMTNKKCFLTKIGRNSMAIYIIHDFLVKYIIKPYIRNNFAHDMTFCIVVLGVAFIIVFVLSRDFVTDALNKLTDGIFRIFFDETNAVNSN